MFVNTIRWTAYWTVAPSLPRQCLSVFSQICIWKHAKIPEISGILGKEPIEHKTWFQSEFIKIWNTKLQWITRPYGIQNSFKQKLNNVCKIYYYLLYYFLVVPELNGSTSLWNMALLVPSSWFSMVPELHGCTTALWNVALVPISWKAEPSLFSSAGRACGLEGTWDVWLGSLETPLIYVTNPWNTKCP